MQQLSFDLGSAMSSFRKSEAPALGPAFSHQVFDPSVLSMPGGSTIMFDLDKLTMADYRTMRYHPQINASLSLITFMIHQLDWTIECEDKKIADTVEENVRLIWTRLIRAISQSFWAGYSPSVLEWENTNNGKNIFISKIKDLTPEQCEVNWKEVESSYRPPRSENPYNQVIPKVKVFDGIKKFGLGYPIPTEHSFWYPLLIENGDYYGKKLLKPAFTSWYFSILMHLFSNRYFERFGEPVPVGRAPFEEEFKYKDADGAEKSKTGKQAMEDILRSLRNRGTVVLPSDRDPTASSGGGRSEYMYDIEYLESQMRGADFERYMERLDEEISLSIFTPMLLLRTGSVGSLNLGVQHTQTWLWSLNAIAGDIKEYIDRYICERIKEYNFSPNAPRVEWVPKKMGKENPETIRAIISGLISGKMAKPDLDELGTALGMTLEEIKQVDPLTPLPGDPNDPLNKTGQDTRDRATRVRVNDQPRKVGEPLATGRQIAARIGGQVGKAWKEGAFGATTTLSMGYRKRFSQSLVDAGWSDDEAPALTDSLYSKMDEWLKVASSLGQDEFLSPEDFVETFQRRLTEEIESIAS